MRTFKEGCQPKMNWNWPEKKWDTFELEIGAGAGDHALQRVYSNKKVKLVAIERTKEKFSKFQKKYSYANKPQNLIPVFGDAVSWISQFSEADCIEKCFILYPNPYPKASQSNKRFANMPFMEKLIWSIQPGGELVFATNLKWLYEDSKQAFEQEWKLKLIADEEIKIDSKFNNITNEPISKAWAPRTLFEKKYLERGETCYNLVFQKPNNQ